MFWLLLLVLALVRAPFGPPPPPTVPDAAEIALVKARLGPLQLLSFIHDREYCGYLVADPDGALEFTEMVRGNHDGCTPLVPGKGMRLIASIHTHGSYDRDVPAEFPTVLDLTSDRRERVQGYISTPGGRLWYVDSPRMEVRQLCGLGCLPQDPEFQAGDDGEIAQVYTIRQLMRLESPE